MNDFWARRVWERRDPLASLLWILLLPLSFLYGLGAWLRNLLYSLGWLRARSLPRPVISVGNLTVGGTGKTPTTLWLAHELGKWGYRVAILSRGYRRKDKEPVILGPSDSARNGDEAFAAGDEPVMMARVFGQRVGVGAKRYEVASRLLREAEVDVFLLDDGFQHRQLKRDLDLLLLGSDRDGWLLPAGPFREPKGSLRRAHFYLITDSREKWEHFLASREKRSIFFGSLQPSKLLSLEGNRWKEYPLSLLDRSKIVTVCAIARPALFYRMIHEWEGEIVDTLEFRDHHVYSTKDWQRINRAGRSADFIVTTEKDILKLTRFPFAREKLLALRVEMVVEDGPALIRAVEKVIQEKLRNID